MGIATKSSTMARFLIGTLPITGHVYPILPVARKLVERGHEVAWYAGERFRLKIERTGARWLPMKQARDFDDQDIEAAFPERAEYHGLARLKFDLLHVFGASIDGQMRDLEEILAKFPADVLVSDNGFLGPALLHEKGGPPWAVFGVTPLTIASRDTAPFGLGLPPSSTFLGRTRNRWLRRLVYDVLFHDVNAYYQQMRTHVGLPPTGIHFFDASVSPFLFLQSSVSAFEYPRCDLPPQVHFIGACLPDAPDQPFQRPPWWAELNAGKPVVLVTQGTLATGLEELMAPALQGLATEDVLVVATTGGKPYPHERLGPVPANARIESFLPYAALMPHVDVLVTNGGYGTVQMALAHGVPVVASGTSEDKPEVCGRVAWADVGIRLKERSPSAGAIRSAVKSVLSEPRFRQRAEWMQREFARHDAPLEAALLLEQLAFTKQAVTSPSAHESSAT